ncbi:MAG: bifunctional 2-C-methyl-D-erythritol 4-phosphate cytidylyltransferase/2-C-methyl-D-erythritol 2,4-cyclodiphosphate synthase [Pseudomonadota bacterium]
MESPTFDAIILAAGRGLRLGGAIPKQFLAVGGQTVLARSIAAFASHPCVRRVVVALGEGDADAFAAAAPRHAGAVATVVGGATRQSSVRAALDHLAADPPDNVLIHDAARPFVSASVIDRVAGALTDGVAAIPAIPVADTLKAVAGGVITATVPRDGLFQAQTPQGFRFQPLLAAHQGADDALTDDAGLMEMAGHTVMVVDGARANAKITTGDDLAEARRAFGGRTAVGQGFDVHRIVDGGPMILGGLTLDVPFRLDGHSDADVALHALTDALLGAIADGDIGSHFPPSDPTWKGAASDQFLRHAIALVSARGTVTHLDLTIICERPKIGPVREAMRAKIAVICGLSPARVSVKATTSERLGFTGRGEGIAAQALATVALFEDAP